MLKKRRLVAVHMVKDVLWSTEYMKQIWFSEIWIVIFRILKNQYLAKVGLNFKETL